MQKSLRTFAETIEGEGISSKSDLAKRMQHIADGQPMYRWVDADGVARAGFAPPTDNSASTAVYPTYAEVQKAVEWLGNKLETPQTRVKVKISGRIERSATDRAMDTLSAADLEKLAGRVVRALPPASDDVDEE